MNPGNFFAELKRRNVYRVAVAYAVVGWLLIQVATQTFPFFEVPNWVVRAIILVLLLGFPVALVLAWAYDITPEGIMRTATADAMGVEPRKTGRKLDFLIISVLLVVIALLAVDRYRPHLVPHPGVPGKSIAVLPFENLSGDAANAYFADGIQEGILTRLAQIGSLKVISRTSTQKYKSTPGNLREVAQKLGVSYILEGTVQKTGDDVRITAQLINALNDSHLWADVYDRKLIDTLTVESEVARNIASALETKLSGPEERALAARPTEKPEAYELYLKGKFFWNKRTAGGLITARTYFEQAVAVDPKYSAAYAALSETFVLIPLFGAGTPRDYFPKARTAAQRAIELDDNSAEAHAALGLLHCFDDLRFAESEKEFKRSIQLNPNYATAHHWFGHSLLVGLGRFDEAIAEGKRAVELDPLSLVINADLGGTCMVAGRLDEAIDQLVRTVALDTNFSYSHWNLGEALYLKGDRAGAIAEYEKARSVNEDPEVLGLLGRAYAEAGNAKAASEVLQRMNKIAQHGFVREYLFAMVYIGMGDKQTAIHYLEHAYEDHDNIDTEWARVDPLLDALRGEPRFQQLVERMFVGHG